MTERYKVFVMLFMVHFVEFVGASGDYCHGSTKNGKFDATFTLIHCQYNHIQDPTLPISYVKGFENETLHLKVQFGLNNLIFVDELQSTMQIDFYFRLWWQDIRWDIPDLWTNLTDNVAREGLEVYYLTQLEEPLTLWLPDIEFQDFLEINVGAEQLLKLRPGGKFFWSRHVNIILKQPEMSLENYPLDRQEIVMRFLSYGLSANFVIIYFEDPPIFYVTDEEGTASFAQNPVWVHEVGDFSSQIFSSDYSEEGSDVPLIYQTLEVTIGMDRDGNGILVRFALPILILLLLAGLTFWANVDSRIETTMTILLSVSALYVVILGNIPLLGYLTSFDSWIFFMYLLLSLCVLAHQLVVVCGRKADKWPLRGVYVRTVEVMGRCLIVPAVIAIYGHYFNADDETYAWLNTLLFVISAAFLLISLRELLGLWKSVLEAKKNIEDKMENSMSDQSIRLSFPELVVYNLLVFRTFDLTTRGFVSRIKRKKRAMGLVDEKCVALSQLHHDSSESSNQDNSTARRASAYYDSDDDDDE